MEKGKGKGKVRSFMKVWITVKWVKDNFNRWLVMAVYFGHLLPDQEKFQNYTCQEAETGEKMRLLNPDEFLAVHQKKVIA